MDNNSLLPQTEQGNPREYSPEERPIKQRDDLEQEARMINVSLLGVEEKLDVMAVLLM